MLCAKHLEFMTLSFYVLTAFALMIPLSHRLFKEGILTYISVSILSVFLVGFPESVVYITICGGYTLLAVFLREKNCNFYLSILFKILFTNAVLVLFYFVFRSFIQVDLSKLNISIGEVKIYHYVIVVTIVTVLYDLFLSYAYKYLNKLTERFFN